MKDIKDLLGCEFQFYGRGEDNKYDCYGLVEEVMRRVDINIPDKRTFIDASLRDAAFDAGKEDYVKLDKPEPFCIVLFNLKDDLTTHIGVVLGDSKSFIHILPKRRVAVEKLKHRYWSGKIEGYYRYVGEKNNAS